MSVIITSFRESDNILKSFPDVKCYSVSRRQPKGYFYDELPFLAPYDDKGKALSLSGYPDNKLARYQLAYYDNIHKHEEQFEEWLQSLDNDVDIALCCWCPHSTSTRKQLKKFLTFACHTGIIGQIINHRRPDIQLWLDHDHAEHLVKLWKPENYRIIET